MDLATEAGKQFLTQGLLGALVLISFGVIAFLFKDGRSKDALLISTLTAWREDTKISNEKLFVALETVKAVMQQGGRIK